LRILENVKKGKFPELQGGKATERIIEKIS